MRLMRWWLVQHAIYGGPWIPVRALTVFGIPLVTFFYRAKGPYESFSAAEKEATP